MALKVVELRGVLNQLMVYLTASTLHPRFSQHTDINTPPKQQF